ncbi:MAG: (2Fe-2S)-binding protein [Myxococcales bacterium]|nr:(2Fe-2S)-binding protein [Myxococcales bacterium]
MDIEGYPTFEAEEGSTLLEACEAAGVPMDSACGGFAACNSCRITVLEGAEALGPVLEEETCFLDAPDQRLGCQIRLRAPLRCRLDPGC